MDYDEFTGWMFGLERFGIKLGLENTADFMSRLGNPERDLKSVHVTGTNGKGSVCVLVAEVLRKHGMKVGLYTSPHLVDFRERIEVNGRKISEKDVLRIGTELKKTMEAMASEDREKQLTFFEFTTGLAFKYFSEKKVDIVVAEVGMGGRLDATNILSPEVSVITRIGLEHTNYLGATIPDIAREKAGIIKSGVSVVTCEGKPEALSVIESTCSRKGAQLRRLGRDFNVSDVRQSLAGTAFDYFGVSRMKDLRVRLLGGYQSENAAAAIAVIEELDRRGIHVSEEDVRNGLLSARWPGRLDIVSKKPLVIFDGSHNPDGVKTTASVLRQLDLVPLTVVVGCMDDKDARGIVRALAPVAAKMIVTQARYKRALSAEALHRIVQEEFNGDTKVFPEARTAFETSLNEVAGKGICIIGSLYLVGEAIEWWSSRADGARARSHKV